MDGLVADGIKLMRHYVHAMCTPTRVSFFSGRLPVHSGQLGLCSPDSEACGIPYEATTIGSKMVEAGYEAHQVGKWDTGMASTRHTPHGRGFNTSLGYFGHGNYQWGQIEWGKGGCNGNTGCTEPPVTGVRDLWDTDKPAHAASDRSRDDGVYEEALFYERMRAIIAAHDVEKPLFLVYCARIAHYPIQAPLKYQQIPRIASINVRLSSALPAALFCLTL